jgi:hypothetical protein
MMCLDVDTKLYSNTANKANRFGSKVTQKEFSNDQFSFVNVIPLAKLMLLGATTTTRKTNYALFSLYRSSYLWSLGLADAPHCLQVLTTPSWIAS